MEGERGAITDGDETTVHFSLSPSYSFGNRSQAYLWRVSGLFGVRTVLCYSPALSVSFHSGP